MVAYWTQKEKSRNISLNKRGSKSKRRQGGRLLEKDTERAAAIHGPAWFLTAGRLYAEDSMHTLSPEITAGKWSRLAGPSKPRGTQHGDLVGEGH